MNKLEAEPRNPAEKTECSHYWVIESPNGPTSKGVCKYCGAEEEFSNYTPHYRGTRIGLRRMNSPVRRHSSLTTNPTPKAAKPGSHRRGGALAPTGKKHS